MLTLLRVHFHFAAFCIGLPADVWGLRPAGRQGNPSCGRAESGGPCSRCAPARTSPAALSDL